MEKNNKKPQKKTKEKILEEYLEASKDKKDYDIEDIIREGDFFIKLYGKS